MTRTTPDFKRYFSYRELWEETIQTKSKIPITVTPYQLFYHDKTTNRTRIIRVSSELACWRIIDLAIFMLRFDAGETEIEFPERHKTLERKAFFLAFGNDYYDPRRFDPTIGQHTKKSITKTFIFEVDGIRVTKPMVYKGEPTKEQVIHDMQAWFFEQHAMWFAVKENGVETNLQDY